MLRRDQPGKMSSLTTSNCRHGEMIRVTFQVTCPKIMMDLCDNFKCFERTDFKMDVYSSIRVTKDIFKNHFVSLVGDSTSHNQGEEELLNYLLSVEFCFEFDGLLLEDQATFVGLGIVDGDIIYVTSKQYLVHWGSHYSEKYHNYCLGTQDRKRTADEISVGLNVLLGELEGGLHVVQKDSFDPREEITFGSWEAYKSLTCCEDELQKVKTVLMPALVMAMEDSKFKSVKRLPDFSIIVSNLQSGYQHEVDLAVDFDKVIEAFEKNIPKKKTETVDIRSVLVRKLLSIVKKFYEASADVHTCIPARGGLYIGPERNSDFSNYLAFLPTVQLKKINRNTTLRDLVVSYKAYSENTNLEVPSLSYNNESFDLNKKVFDVIGKLGKGRIKHYFSFPFDVIKSEDTRLIDDLVDFIEGEGEHQTSANKKKRKKKRKSNNVEVVENETRNDDISGASSRNDEVEMIAKESNQIVTGDSNNSNDAKSDEDKVEHADRTSEAGAASRYKDISENVEDEFDAEKSQLNRLCKEKCDLEAAIAVELEHLGVHKQTVEDIIGSKSKEMKNLILLMEKSDDDKTGKVKKITEVDTQLADLESKIIELKMKKADLVKDCDGDDKLIQKFEHKRHKLDGYIENELKKAKEEENGIDTKIQNLRKMLTETTRAIQNLPNQVMNLPTVQLVSQNNQLLEFIDKQISEKKKELECPVCFEVAAVPIFMCSELHLICTNCRPKVKECPECRIHYEDKPKRHRYAEKTAEELIRLKNERLRIVEPAN